MTNFLLLGMLFSSLAIPLEAKAGFFSSLLGNEAHAEINTHELTASDYNSQTMALLEANVSSVPIFQDKKTKTEPVIDDNAKVTIVSDNALFPTASPFSNTLEGIGNGDFSFYSDIEVYVVRSGDTVDSVAKLFDVSADTILSANNMKKGDKLKVDDVLLILPFSGIEHTVIKGETLQGIANRYKVDLKYILNANDLDTDAKIGIGEKLMIPGGGMLSETKPKSGSSSVAKGGSSSSSMPSVSGYFKNPVSGARRTRGIIPGKHQGVDLAAPTGTPIHAAADGKVSAAKTGWNGGFGNMAIIQHPNGCKTLYAHMSRLGTTTGAQVSQGEVIGYVGSTGHSTGSHLHIETPGCKNPF